MIAHREGIILTDGRKTAITQTINGRYVTMLIITSLMMLLHVRCEIWLNVEVTLPVREIRQIGGIGQYLKVWIVVKY